MDHSTAVAEGQSRGMFGRALHGRASRDLIVIAIAACVVGVLGGLFDILEWIVEWSQGYEGWEIDELITISIFLSLAFAVFAKRRWGELRGELTERQRAQAMLEQTTADLARSNRELEHFAYVASHDLQEPLRMVASYVQLLERRYKGELDADADDFIGYTVDGVNRMQELINGLLAYSRVGTHGEAFQPTDSAAALEEAVANLQAVIDEADAAITHDTLPTVSADHMQLVQLLQNLIGNAIKFRGDEPPRVHVSAEQKRGEWAFAVRDNGIGIDPQYADRIFGVFQRLHAREEYPGTGLGLAICKKIVAHHGGRIWVESQIGEGSAFYFTIPIDQEMNSYDQSNDRKTH